MKQRHIRQELHTIDIRQEQAKARTEEQGGQEPKSISRCRRRPKSAPSFHPIRTPQAFLRRLATKFHEISGLESDLLDYLPTPISMNISQQRRRRLGVNLRSRTQRVAQQVFPTARGGYHWSSWVSASDADLDRHN